MAPTLQLAFTLHVDLSPSLEFGDTHCGSRRFIPITGGTVEGPKLTATIVPGGGDWNVLREDGITHLFAKYTIQSSDGVFISVTNEGWIRKFRKEAGENGTKKIPEDQWYAKTSPRFEVQEGVHGWLNRTVFVGELRKPSIPNHVVIDVYSVE
ncbi:hypothetical protein N7466_006577 [Penicillium verhagenii]|uniref:uncharacterized protein n=1 Tax=Penicillium verhagenii TaxID=1562060 RepID=UPI002545A2FA|nr:uncharacterized protein N7466_006577 [Penicillium verhagenii]KAJ5931084.1 hypothetical protein N7466_006577 [Penicillium verhagenii]